MFKKKAGLVSNSNASLILVALNCQDHYHNVFNSRLENMKNKVFILSFQIDNKIFFFQKMEFREMEKHMIQHMGDRNHNQYMLLIL